MINPLTALAAGACGWILVLGLNSPVVSLAMTAVACVLGVWRTRNASVPATTVALAVPVGLSMLLIHVPYGSERIAPLLTADGLAVGAALAARFCALMACMLAAVAYVRIPELVKALQVLPGGNKLAYIAGATLQLVPHGSAQVKVVRDAQALKRAPVHARNVVTRLIMPVLTALLSQGASRGAALETAGYDLPGRRTVLRPVPDSAAQKALRIVAPIACVAVVVWI
ncbi:energy-coupling factor transporter transmembrane component T [Corynebacterium hadale]|uniref:energy-coupling factor transporter transmembrane component T n=1 Tax=Corynebacterium hadale TaxID=2026255 RepID=UPI001F0AE1B7|nr:energy-coupling factor transporter transmembrane component T [Corynebacterium hadale]